MLPEVSGRSRCYWPMCGSPKWTSVPGMELCQKHALSVWQNVDTLVQGGEVQPPVPVVKIDPTQLPPPLPQTPDGGWIYYLQIGDRIKIGYASSMYNRMRSYPPNSILLAVHPGKIADERRIHREVAHHRVAGREWYGVTPEMVAYVEAVQERHGKPQVGQAGWDVMIRSNPDPELRMRSSTKAGRRRIVR